MRKITKLLLGVIILIASTIVISYLYFDELEPRIKYPQCYDGGGKWRTFPNTCGDSCSFLEEEQVLCGQAFWPNCDCGDDKCWDGKRCMPNP